MSVWRPHAAHPSPSAPCSVKKRACDVMQCSRDYQAAHPGPAPEQPDLIDRHSGHLGAHRGSVSYCFVCSFAAVFQIDRASKPACRDAPFQSPLPRPANVSIATGGLGQHQRHAARVSNQHHAVHRATGRPQPGLPAAAAAGDGEDAPVSRAAHGPWRW